MARSYDDEEEDPRDEGPGLVGRLLRTGVSAPNVAMKVLADQVAGWKKDFLGIFQTEIRRFLDRQDPGAELEKILKGKRLEVSVRLVDDDRPSGSSRSEKGEKSAAPKKPARGKKR